MERPLHGAALRGESSSDDDAVAALPLLAIGTQVEVTNCQGQGQFSGIVVDVNAEARSYAIKYDDDNYESDVDAGRVREELEEEQELELTDNDLRPEQGLVSAQVDLLLQCARSQAPVTREFSRLLLGEETDDDDVTYVDDASWRFPYPDTVWLSPPRLDVDEPSDLVNAIVEAGSARETSGTLFLGDLERRLGVVSSGEDYPVYDDSWDGIRRSMSDTDSDGTIESGCASPVKKMLRSTIVDGAVEAAFGLTSLSLEFLREAGKVSGYMPGNPHAVVMAYCEKKGLKSVDDLVEHYAAGADQVKDTFCDAEMAFSRLACTLCRLENLRLLISSLNSGLFAKNPDVRASRHSEEMRAKSHPEMLELLGQVCAQHKKEEPLRIASKYELAVEIVKKDDETSSADLARLLARGYVYAKTGMCDTCVPLDEINKKVLDVDFDSELHLAPEAIDFSGDGFTCQIAAKPGPDSRLALTKIANVPIRRPL